MRKQTMTKSELASIAGVSATTFRKWLHLYDAELAAMGISPNAKLLTPKAVAFICDKFGITLD